MKFGRTLALLMLLAAIQLPCYAAEEDKELSLIAAEQERPSEDEQLGEVNPALTDSITTKPTQETDKEVKERKKKLRQTRKEKEKANEQKLKETANQKETPVKEQPIIIDPSEPISEPTPPTPPPPPAVEPTPIQTPQPTLPTLPTVQPAETTTLTNQKAIYADFAEVARAVKFIPLYLPKKTGYEITSVYAGQGVAEVRYGRRWEPTVSLTIKTHKRADGEELQDISGVSGVKWRVNNTTGTTIYIAKISETQQVAAWAVGQYTFSAQAENLSYAGFHSLVADELVELTTHYYLDF